MRIITLDFETYFGSDYTLSNMTTEEYVRDSRFEAHGAAVVENGQAIWLDAREIAAWCAHACRLQEQGQRICLIAQHAHFDGLILNHHFSFRPDFWMDTLSMARVVFGPGVKNSLGDIASRLGLGTKTVPYDLFRDRHWHELAPDVQRQVADGCCQDALLTHKAAGIMLKGGPNVPYPFPASELPIVDLTVRMFTEPVLIGDIEALGEAWQAEQALKKDLFRRASEMAGTTIEPADLRKDGLFAQLLEQFGVEPETKVTTKGNEKYAFAKSDYFMQDLLTDEDEDVALLAECRLKAQSSIYQTRIERYGSMALRGPMCIYLAYGAAHTRRWGGGDKTNFQNLPRPDKTKPQKGALRRAIRVPR
jgi:hypothetical protein